MPQLPAGWKETTLGKLLDVKHGFAFKWDYISDKDNGNVLLTPWNFAIWGGWKDWKKFYNWEIPISYILKWWEIVITMTDLSKDWDTLGFPAIVPIDDKRVFLHNQRIWLVEFISDNLDLKYCFYKLKTNEYQKYIVNTASWSTVRHTSPDKIKSFIFHLPPLPEQQAIAAVLSSFDDKIELLRAENQTLEQMGQELFKERFCKWKIGDELPEGWRVGKITEIIRRESISYKCDKKDLDDKGLTPILDQGSTGLYGYTSRDPDFIATKDNPVIIFTNHTCNFWFIDYPFCAIQNILPYRWINGYDGYFLYFMTKGSIKFTEYKGHRPSFVALDFVIPPVELAQEFSKIAEGILKKISWNKEQIQNLSAIRDQLLPKLMSWEVRVEF